jgi:predicted cobalt transporter CbtA
MTTKLLERVDPSRLASLALTAVLVGLLAGLAGATFARIAGEPLVDDAIAIEEANAAADPDADDPHAAEEATVSRSDQRGFGLFSAYALTGAAFGALLALTSVGIARGRPDAARRILVAGVILAGAFTVAPWFKYPPNPPAVGDPGTLGERQNLYIVVIVIAALVGLAATVVSRRLEGWALHRRLPVLVGVVAVPMLLAYALLPGAPDDVTVPATLVWRFRVASLGANLTLWTVLTLGVAWLAAEATARRNGSSAPVDRAAVDATT